jgi:hypothetical protein
MKRKQLILMTVVVCGALLCSGQTFQTKKDLGRFEFKSRQDSRFYGLKSDDNLPENDPTKGVLIENSLPKGGGQYTDATGKKFGYAIFWTRVINETATPLELIINFPGDSLLIDPSPDYSKFFLVPGTMSFDKEILYSYGLTGLEAFLDSAFYKPMILKRTINPKEEFFFYTAMLSYRAANQDSGRRRKPGFHERPSGSVRGGFYLKAQGVFYNNNLLPQLDSASIPWGHIVVKN